MERQTAERVALYARRNSPGEPLPINISWIDIADHTPMDGEIWRRHGDVKAWLHRIKLEEDPKTGPNNENAGDNWRRFVALIQAIWDHGDISPHSFSG